MEITDCTVTMGRIPGKAFNYSDHDGVEATVNISRTDGKYFL